MNSLDIALGVFLLFFLIRGIFRGFIKETTSIVAVAVGFILASKYYILAAEAIKPFIHDPDYRQVIGFLIVFLGSFIVVGLLGLLLDWLFKLTLSRFTNSVLGGIIAIIKGVLLSSVVLMTASAFIGPQSTFFQKSVSWPYMSRISVALKDLVPEGLKKSMERGLGQLPISPQAGDILQPAGDDDATPPADWQPVPETDQPIPPAWPDSGGNTNPNQ